MNFFKKYFAFYAKLLYNIDTRKEVHKMTQERLLKLAKIGICKNIEREQEIIDRQIERRGKANRLTESRLEKLWQEYDEISEMLKELEK